MATIETCLKLTFGMILPASNRMLTRSMALTTPAATLNGVLRHDVLAAYHLFTHLLAFYVKAITQRTTQHIDGKHQHKQAKTLNNNKMRRCAVMHPGIVYHDTPARRWRLYAKTQKTDSGN